MGCTKFFGRTPEKNTPNLCLLGHLKLRFSKITYYTFKISSIENMQWFQIQY